MKKVLLLVLLAGTGLFAQQTSTIQGTVVDDAGAGLPGVVVTAESPRLQGTRTAVTRANGTFIFRLIPPGDYTLTATMTGFKTAKINLSLGLGQLARPTITLSPEAMEESLVVTADIEPVLSTNTVITHYDKDFVNKIAGGRSQSTLAAISPGASSRGFGGAVSLSGAPSHANSYLVNGVDSRFDNLRGGSANVVIEDAIQETSVMTSAISAEYGNFGGGVVNTITKSGGNRFEGSFRTEFTNPKWSEQTPYEQERNLEEVDELNKAYSITLGGPIIKDRLWFFLAGYTFDQSRESSYLQGIAMSDRAAEAYGLAPNQPVNNPTSIPGRKVETERYELKLTASINDKHQIVGSYQYRNDADFNNGSGPLTEEALWPVRNIPVEGYSFNYRGDFTDSLSLDVLYSNRDSTFEERPTGHIEGDFRIKGTLLRDRRTFGRFNSALFLGKPDEPRSNETLRAKMHYFFISDATGTHDLTAGFEDFTDSRLVNNRQSLNDWQFWSDVRYEGNTPIPVYSPTSADGRYRSRLIYYPIENPSLGSDLNAKSIFINDVWTLNDRWNFNIGFRYEDRSGKAQDGTPTVDDQAFSPRLSVNYQATERHGFSASYSQYVNRIGNAADDVSEAGAPTFAWLYYDGPQTEDYLDVITWMNDTYGADFFFDPLNHPNTQAWRDDLWVNNLYDPAGASVVVDGQLASPVVDEIRIGHQWRLDRGFIKTDFITRDFSDFYVSNINSTTGPTANGLADLTVLNNNDSNYERNYNSVQIQGRYDVTDNFILTGNYTWSQLYGNIDAESSSGVSGTETTTTVYPEFNSFANRNPVGYLHNDQRHKMRLYAIYNLKTAFGDWNFSATQRWESGSPYNEVLTIPLDEGLNAEYGLPERNAYDYYLSPPSSTNYYIGGRGAHRGESMTQTNLGINWEMSLSRAKLYVEIDVFNIFNEDALTNGWNINNTVDPTDVPFDVRSETPVLGTHYTRGSSFGEASNSGAYQSPRSYAIDVGVRF